MSRVLVQRSIVFCLFSLSACTQSPVEVDNRGNSLYGRNSVVSSGYSAATVERFVNEPPVQSAPADHIGVSDLSAPEKTKESKADVPFKAASKPLTQEEKAPAKIAALPEKTEQQAVNPWTRKPRENPEEETAKQPTTKQPERQAKLVEQKPEKPVASAKSSEGFIWPVNGKKIVSGYGKKNDGKVNDGINIASREGDPVWAAADGEVVYVGNGLSGYGNMVLVKHVGNKTTTYAHLKRMTVDKYDRVKQGDIIGYVGSTGNVKSPQLHFAVRQGKEPLDPRKVVNSKVAGL